jgi:hypothetical protein
MKTKNNIFRTLLLFVAFFVATTIQAQCLNQGYDLSNKKVYTSTGNADLDTYLNGEKKYIESIFKVKVELKVLDDSGSPNAFATPESSNTYFFDGTVFLGYALLSEEMAKNKNGIDAVRGIMGHEFAHILQNKLECPLQESSRELHADFLAGYYMGKRGLYSADGLTAFAKSLYEKGDSQLWDESHHGTPKQRLNIMLAGYYASNTISSPQEAYNAGLRILTNDNNAGELTGNGQNTTNTNNNSTGNNKKEVKNDPKTPQSIVVTVGSIKYDQVFSIKFTVAEIEYNGLLLLKNGVGKMRIRYPKGTTDQIIEETMTSKVSDGETYVEGSSVIDVINNKYTSDYSADSFYFSKNETTGETEIWVEDEKGHVGKVQTEMLTNSDLANQWLSYLKW